MMSALLARIAMFLNGAWRDAFAARIGHLRWSFAPGGRVLLAVGAVLALILALLCYYRTTEGLSRRSRLVLAILRWTALASLLIMAAGAVCSVELVDRQLPNIILIVDDSPSMGLAMGNSTRIKEVEAALKNGLKAKLENDYSVEIRRSSGMKYEGAVAEDNLPQSISQQVVAQSAQPTGAPVSDILIISDGVELNNARPLSDAAQQLPATISAISVGDEKIQDVILQDVTVPGFVYKNDRALVIASVRSLGMEGEATLQLSHLQNGSEKEVASTKVTLKPGDEPSVARIEFRADDGGLQHYILRALTTAGELTDRNNSVTFHLDVRPEKIRVLFVEGEPSWEYRYAKEALESDPAVEFYGLVRMPEQEWFFQGNSTRPDGKPVIKDPKKGFPESAEELNFFDVLILGDLERKLFEQGGRFAMVDAFVRAHGGGLATIGGLKVYGAGNYEGTDLARLLPIEIVKESKVQLLNRFTVQVTGQGMMHPIMQLEFDPTKNAEAWAGLPWVEGGNALAAIKPGATLLATHPTLRTRFGPRPIGAAWQSGRGRVYSSALDGTWHWRLARKTETDYHQRYWGLTARWLGGDPRTSRAIGSLVCDDATLEVAQPTTFWLMVRDGDGNPLLDAHVDFTIDQPDGKSIAAQVGVDPSTPGRYALPFVPTQTGEHKVTVRVGIGDAEPQTQSNTYLISESRQEFLHPQPDPKALASLVLPGGGTSVPLSAAMTDLKFPPRPPLTQSRPRVIELWQSPGLMIVLLGCLILEWLLRKRRGLS